MIIPDIDKPLKGFIKNKKIVVTEETTSSVKNIFLENDAIKLLKSTTITVIHCDNAPLITQIQSKSSSNEFTSRRNKTIYIDNEDLRNLYNNFFQTVPEIFHEAIINSVFRNLVEEITRNSEQHNRSKKDIYLPHRYNIQPANFKILELPALR